MTITGNKTPARGDESFNTSPNLTVRNADALPARYERHFDKKGLAYYSDHNTRTTSRLNPLTAKELQQEGKEDRELIMPENMENGEVYFVHYGRDLPAGKIVGAPSSQEQVRSCL